MQIKNTRREFFKNTLKLSGLMLVLPQALSSLFSSKATAADVALPLVDPTKPGMAQGVKYHHKTSDVKDAALKKEKAGVPFEKQNCANCSFYTKEGMKGGEEVGKCTLFPNQVVKATGWCNTWAKKA